MVRVSFQFSCTAPLFTPIYSLYIAHHSTMHCTLLEFHGISIFLLKRCIEQHDAFQVVGVHGALQLGASQATHGFFNLCRVKSRNGSMVAWTITRLTCSISLALPYYQIWSFTTSVPDCFTIIISADRWGCTKPKDWPKDLRFCSWRWVVPKTSGHPMLFIRTL